MSNLVVFIQPDFSFSDERGCLYQLCRNGWSQVNVSKSVKGVKRGGHYHKQTKEAFFIIEGEILLTLDKEGKTEQVTVKTGDFFCFEPFTKHSFEFLADTTMVALYDHGVELSDGTKDIYTE